MLTLSLLITIFYTIIIVNIVIMFIVKINTQVRVFYFLTLLLIVNSILLYYNFDGLALLLLLTEFTVIFTFILTYSTIYTNKVYEFREVKLTTLTTILTITILLYTLSLGTLDCYLYTNYFSTIGVIINTDFFSLYYFFFINRILITFLLIIILSVFSFFFIILFFNLKNLKNNDKNKIKNFLKKQEINNQITYQSHLRTFQK